MRRPMGGPANQLPRLRKQRGHSLAASGRACRTARRCFRHAADQRGRRASAASARHRTASTDAPQRATAFKTVARACHG